MARRRRKRKSHRLGLGLMWAVVLLHAGVIAVFAYDPYKPGAVHVPELWALERKWQFYLLIAATGGAAALNLLAWRTRAPVKLALSISWLLFGVVLIGYHADRVAVMARLMLRHG